MTLVRRVLAIVWLSGVVLATAGERVPPRSPGSFDSFVVLAADFHVHSFPGDGALPPWSLVREARRRGLDVVALTNHNQMLSSRLARWTVGAASGVLVLPGQEVTTPAYHMTAIGIDRTIGWSRSAATVAADVHARGGVAIAAHPDDRAAAAIDGAFHDVDGIESAHPMRLAAPPSARELDAAVVFAQRLHPGIAQVGASDFHYLAPLGLCRTFVFVREATRDGVLEAIRAGRTVGCDARGDTYGEARLRRVVASECAAAAATRGVAPRTDRLALACAWLGALGLTLTGPRRGIQ